MSCAPAGTPVRVAWRSSATWIRFGRSAPLPGVPPASMANRIYGVGSMDMKGGIVIALWALRALRELNLFPDTTDHLYAQFGRGDRQQAFRR